MKNMASREQKQPERNQWNHNYKTFPSLYVYNSTPFPFTTIGAKVECYAWFFHFFSAFGRCKRLGKKLFNIIDAISRAHFTINCIKLSAFAYIRQKLHQCSVFRIFTTSYGKTRPRHPFLVFPLLTHFTTENPSKTFAFPTSLPYSYVFVCVCVQALFQLYQNVTSSAPNFRV